MSIVKEKKIANSYLRFMKNWDNETKKDLIIRLTASIDDKSKNGSDFSLCFGAWEDERSADEIIDEIYSDRINTEDYRCHYNCK